MMSTIAVIMSTSRDELSKFVAGKIETGKYFKSSTLAKTLLSELYDLAYHHIDYRKCVINWTFKVAKILKEYMVAGVLEIYRKGNNATVYKKKEKEVKSDENDR